MRLLRKEAGKFQFAIGRREKALLKAVLNEYPLVPLSHHQLFRGEAAADGASDQGLLEEAMDQQKQEHKQWVASLLTSKTRFRKEENGQQVSFSAAEMERLLQVLNDVRVGSWLILGCPDPDEGTLPNLTEANARFLFLMELSGQFECELLEALDNSL